MDSGFWGLGCRGTVAPLMPMPHCAWTEGKPWYCNMSKIVCRSLYVRIDQILEAWAGLEKRLYTGPFFNNLPVVHCHLKPVGIDNWMHCAAEDAGCLLHCCFFVLFLFFAFFFLKTAIIVCWFKMSGEQMTYRTNSIQHISAWRHMTHLLPANWIKAWIMILYFKVCLSRHSYLSLCKSLFLWILSLLLETVLARFSMRM